LTNFNQLEPLMINVLVKIIPRFKKQLFRIFKWVRSPQILLIIALCLVASIYMESVSFDYNIDDGLYFEKIVMVEYDGIFDAINVFKEYFNFFDYRPVTSLLFVLEQVFFGRDAGVFHLFNVFYFLILCLVLLVSFNKYKIFSKREQLFLFILIFAIHPSHVEVVASIKNRDIIIASILALLGSNCLFNAFASGKLKMAIYLLLSLVFAYLTLITKSDAILIYAIPLIIIVYKRIFTLRKVGAILIVSLVMLFLARYLMFLNLGSIDTSTQAQAVGYFENPLVETNSLLSLLEMQFKAFFYYSIFQFIPIEFLFYYGYNMIPLGNFMHYTFIAGFLFFILLASFIGYSFFRKKQNLLSISCSIFLVLTLPYLIFISNIAGIIAVRYGFYASIGSTIIIAIALYGIYQRNKWVGFVFGIVFIYFLTIFSRARCLDWQSQETLFAKDMPRLKDSFIANRMVGTYYMKEADYVQQPEEVAELLIESRKYLFQAYSLYDSDPVLLRVIGNGFLKEQNFDSAFFYFKRLTDVDGENAESWKQMAEFATIVSDEKHLRFSVNKILEIDKGNEEAIKYMNNLLTQQNKLEELEQFNRKMIQENTKSYLPYLYLAQLYQSQNNRPLAMINYFEAFNRGFVDERLKNNLVRYAISQNYQEIIQRYPMFFR
jgi:hypothetical protein